MTPEENKAYQRGYRAGRQTAKERRAVERIRREKQAMLDRIYLTLLPVAMTVEGWLIDGKPVKSTVDRVRTAELWAAHAIKRRPIA